MSAGPRSTLVVERHGRVGWLVFNRPESGNAMNAAMIDELEAAWRELGWAATFLASPYARFISGHTLVVDGANWQRRLLTNPPVVTVRDQMGRGQFEIV